MQLFYSENIISSLMLNKEESKHCLKVLRRKKNDIIFITNGNGELFKSKIIEIEKDLIKIEIVTKTKLIRNKDIELAISLPKNRNRIEWIIEKVTELGVKKITPIICENSERIKLNLERANKIAIASMKQSLGTYLPEISEFQNFFDFIQKSKHEKKYIAHCKEDIEKETIKSLKSKKACILIGPEGDFSDNEIKIAKKGGFKPIKLSENRLRTETAAIVGCYKLIL